MSTSVLRACPPLLPDEVSWYATPSPPLSNVSALTCPGKGAGEPEYGVDVAMVVVVDDLGTMVLSLVTWPGALFK